MYSNKMSLLLTVMYNNTGLFLTLRLKRVVMAFLPNVVPQGTHHLTLHSIILRP